jgi:predicted DNA-binding transcriptional regulator YafY
VPHRSAARHLPRPQVLLLVKHHLDRVGQLGITKLELLGAIGPHRTSLVTIQRALDDLRNLYDAKLTCTGAERRWRLEAPLSLPLLAPESVHLFLMHVAQPMLDSLGLDDGRMDGLVEGFDEQVRKTTSAKKLPTRKVVTSGPTRGGSLDYARFSRLVLACRRDVVRISYASPWKPAGTPPKWHALEPWALRLHDGAFYLRGWSRGPRGVRTFRVVDIRAVEELAADAELTPLHAVPADVWAEEKKAFGMDLDRPDVAVIRFRGGIARFVATDRWHPTERDAWFEDGEVLQRTIRYRSCRELARRLVALGDGIESIEPLALLEEVGRLGGCSAALLRSTARRRAQAQKSRSKSK